MVLCDVTSCMGPCDSAVAACYRGPWRTGCERWRFRGGLPCAGLSLRARCGRACRGTRAGCPEASDRAGMTAVRYPFVTKQESTGWTRHPVLFASEAEILIPDVSRTVRRPIPTGRCAGGNAARLPGRICGQSTWCTERPLSLVCLSRRALDATTGGRGACANRREWQGGVRVQTGAEPFRGYCSSPASPSYMSGAPSSSISSVSTLSSSHSRMARAE